ncbi:MAG: queuosine precursor transporter [Candidatus Comchoanobacterales bacterium]
MFFSSLLQSHWNECMLLLHLLMMSLLLSIAYAWSRFALMMAFVLCMLLANIFLLEEVQLFGMTVTAVEVYTIAGILALNLIQQKYGRLTAQKTIFLGFFGLLIWVVAAHFHLQYHSTRNTETFASAYKLLFLPQGRLFMASIIAYLISTHLEIKLFSQFQRFFGNRWLGMRFLVTVFIVQAVDTLTFGLIGLTGMGFDLFDILLFSYCIKCLVAVGYSPFIGLIQRLDNRRLQWILHLKSFINPQNQKLV